MWIAAYRNDYQPNVASERKGCAFWQSTDRDSFPGMPGGNDGSVFHSTS
jgi:GH25 family lysozyme M1 (1,4-beta-N-acetylmuramidase)